MVAPALMGVRRRGGGGLAKRKEKEKKKKKKKFNFALNDAGCCCCCCPAALACAETIEAIDIELIDRVGRPGIPTELERSRPLSSTSAPTAEL
jgi:hypothetical protein